VATNTMTGQQYSYVVGIPTHGTTHPGLHMFLL